MMKWYRITSNSEEGIRKVLHSLRSQRLMVRAENGNLIACINPDHQVWLSNVCRDFGASTVVLGAAPKGVRSPKEEEYVAPCGEKFYDPLLVANHQRFCAKCRELTGKPVKEKATPKPKPARTVAKLEPGQEFNLNGVIASLEVTRDRLFGQLEVVEGLLTDLQKYREAKDQIDELDSEVKGRIDSVRLLLQDGKLN